MGQYIYILKNRDKKLKEMLHVHYVVYSGTVHESNGDAMRQGATGLILGFTEAPDGKSRDRRQ